jgi:hypothetical protein
MYAIESTNARFPQNRSPQSVDIPMFTPHQLAPTMGQFCLRDMASPDPTTATSGSSAARESISFGSFSFVPHSPASRPAYSSIHEGLNLSIEDLRFHIKTMGVLRLTDLIYSALVELIYTTINYHGSFTTINCHRSFDTINCHDSFVTINYRGSFITIIRLLLSEPEPMSTSLFYLDCNAYHTSDLVNLTEDNESHNIGNSINIKNYYISDSEVSATNLIPCATSARLS